jgi:hypothetical protein
MTDDRFDFSSLDPTADRLRFDAEVASIVSGVIAGHAVMIPRTVFAPIARWRVPALAAAAVIAVASALVLSRDLAAASVASTELAEAIGVPSALAPWLESADVPRVGELMYSTPETP